MSEAVLSTIYTYGAGNVLFHAFNAIAMLFNGSFMPSMLKLSLMLGLGLAAIRSGIQRSSHTEYAKWLMKYLLVILVLMPLPGMTVHIRDVVTNKAYKVDNLPAGLVLPASFMSEMGYSVTKAFETVFSNIDGNYLPYHKYETMFGAQVMSELRDFKIQDPRFAENMESYISNCMMYDVMIGKKYDISDLKTSTDVWKLISDNASELRMLNYRDAAKGGRKLITCKAGVVELEKSFAPEAASLAKKFPIFSSFGNSKNGGTGLVKALEASLTFYGSNVTNAGDQLRQILIINAFKDAPASYGKIKALQTQNSTFQAAGELAQTTLPILHALFQTLLYAVFPIIIVLLFFAQNYRGLQTYFQMMLWIELWPILFAVLNLVVSIYSKEAWGVADITVANIGDITSMQADCAMRASSFGLAIPVLSYMLAWGGVSSFMHIAGSTLGTTSSAASGAAHEVTSGNVSLDNVNIGNRSLNNLGANKVNTAGEIATGFMRQTLSDGSIQTDFMFKNDAQSRIFHGGAGITSSTGDASINTSQLMQESMGRQIQESQSNVASAGKEVLSLEQSVDRQAVDFVARIAENESKGVHYEFGSRVNDTENFNDITKRTKELHETYNYSWEQAANAALNVGVNAAANFSNDVGGRTGVSGQGGASITRGISGGGSIGGSIGNTDTQGLDENRTVMSDKINSHSIETVINTAKNMNYGNSQNAEKNLGNSLSSSYEQIQQKRESLAYHQNKLEQAQSTQDQLASINVSSGQNVYDEVLHYIAQKLDPNPYAPSLRIGTNQARQIMEKGGEQFQHYLKAYQQSKLQNMRMNTGGANNFENKFQQIQTGGTSLSEVAQHKIDSQTMTNTVSSREQELKNTQFTQFNVRKAGLESENEFESRKGSAQSTIQQQKMKTTQQGQEIKDRVNIAERKKLMGKDNPNKGEWNDN